MREFLQVAGEDDLGIKLYCGTGGQYQGQVVLRVWGQAADAVEILAQVSACGCFGAARPKEIGQPAAICRLLAIEDQVREERTNGRGA